MFSINVEIYSLTIIMIFLINYFFHFEIKNYKKKRSYLKLLLSVFGVIIFNILFIILKDTNMDMQIFGIIIIAISAFPPIFLLDYMKRKFQIKSYLSKFLDVFIKLYPIVFCALIIVFYILDIKGNPGSILLLSSAPLLVVDLKLIFKPIHTNLDYKSILLLSSIILCCVVDLFFTDIYLYSFAYSIAILLLYIYRSDINANTDALTGVYNRKIFEHRLNHLTPPKKGHIVSYLIDVDNFKKVNDTYGHLFGDKVLQDVAEILKKSIYNDDYIIRIGGDEFVIIATLYDEQDINIIVNKINNNIEKYNKKNNKGYKLSLSIGYDIYTSESENFRDLIDKIDIKMYKNKNDKK